MLNYRHKDNFFSKFSVPLNFVFIIIKMNHDMVAKKPIIRAFAHV